MGVVGLWPFLKDKGYEPVLRNQSALQNHQPSPPSLVRVDVLGAFFLTVRQAYSSKHLHDAHAILEKAFTQFGTKTTLVLYLDGAPALEKASTSADREEKRRTNLEIAQEHLNEFETLVNANLRLRKRHFVAVSKPLQKAFYWDLAARQSFAQYLKARGWIVVECRTEADLAIGNDCQPGDVVVTRDSDLIIYPKVACIWRPISRGRLLEYRVSDVLASLNITRAQLTVLGVVSRNDYTKNVEGLGPKTNFSIVKRLSGSDPNVMVDAYLADKRVWHKNTEKRTFENSIRVFLKGQQTVVPAAIIEQGQQYIDVKSKFKELCENRTERQFATRRAEHVNGRSESDVETGFRNPFATVENPANCHQHRARYTPKIRFEPVKEQPAPPISMQYVLKPWKEPPAKPTLPQPAKKKPPSPVKPAISDDNRFGRREIKNALAYDHPLVTLDLDRLSTNVHAAVADEKIAMAIVDCIRGAVRAAWATKRQCQTLVGLYLEDLFYPATGASRPGMPVTDITQEDQVILDHLCPRLTSMEMTDKDDADNTAEDGENDGSNAPFFRTFLTFLYSGNLPNNNSKTGAAVNNFIRRLQDMGHMEKMDIVRADMIKNVMEYPPSLIVRSVASQLSAELKRHYRHGSVKIAEKIQTMIKREQLGGDRAIDLTQQQPAIQIFIRANATAGRPWCISPLSSDEHGFMTFTELELAAFLHKRVELHPILKELMGLDQQRRLSQEGLTRDWLPYQTPGCLIQRLVAPVDPRASDGSRLRGRQKKEAGVAAAVRIVEIEELRAHINTLRSDGFDPRTYQEKGYFLAGSIKTDGYNLQLLAYKVRELNSVKYKRYSPTVLPDRMLSTTAGTGDYLTEVRNVFKTPADVERLLGCTPDEIDQVSYLGLDLGQAFVVGAYAYLPPDKNPRVSRRRKNKKRGSRGRRKRGSGRGRKSASRAGRERHINLAANQKAVARPTLRHRTWMEQQKCADVKPRPSPLTTNTESVAPSTPNQPSSSETAEAALEVLSIRDIESSIPPLRGDNANFKDHVRYRKANEARLDTFYNGKRYRIKKYKRLSKKARAKEYEQLADSLLRMVGGSIGEQRQEGNKVVIGVGLGRFSSTSRLSSLHGTFEAYFIAKARSLGYLVIGINEYFTSKKCPTCHQFVAQAGNIRRLYCRHCKKYLHRDVLAGNNITNILRSYVERQERPRYLHPVDKDGKYPWLQEDGDAAGPSRKRHAEDEGPVDTKASGKRIQTTATKQKGKEGKGKARAAN